MRILWVQLMSPKQTFRGALGGLVRAIHSGSRETSGADSHQILFLTASRLRILAAAQDLAAAGTTDDSAVASLRALAGKSYKKELSGLAAMMFNEDITLEDPLENLAARLLTAAGGDTTLPPPTPEATRRMKLASELRAGGPAFTFERLAAYSTVLQQLRETLQDTTDSSDSQKRSLYLGIRVKIMNEFLRPDPRLPEEFRLVTAQQLCLQYASEVIDPSGALASWLETSEGGAAMSQVTPEVVEMLKGVHGGKPSA